MRQLAALGFVLFGIVFPAFGASYYPVRLDDPRAVYLTPDQFPVRGDGKADDSAAIQAAIDKVQETTGEGILFIPDGRYRLTRTVFVWPGVRLIGYGEKRPVFVLADNTPGFQQGIGYMVFFAGGRFNRPPARRLPLHPRRDRAFVCPGQSPERFRRISRFPMPAPAPFIPR